MTVFISEKKVLRVLKQFNDFKNDILWYFVRGYVYILNIS